MRIYLNNSKLLRYSKKSGERLNEVKARQAEKRDFI